MEQPSSPENPTPGRPDDLGAAPGHRRMAAHLIEDAVALVAPGEAPLTGDLVEPLIDRWLRGERFDPHTEDGPGGFGGAELAVFALTPLVLHAVANLVRALGETWVQQLAARGRAPRKEDLENGELFALSLEEAAVAVRIPMPDYEPRDLPELVHAVHEAIWRHVERSRGPGADASNRAPLRFRDFALRIEPDGNGGFRTRVPASAGGGAPSRFEPPFALDDLPWILRGLEGGIRGGTRHLVVAGPTRAGTDPKRLGADLFDALVTGGIRDAFESRSAVGRDRDEGVRLRLVLDPDQTALCACPWELLFDRRRERFLSHDLRTPIVRHLETGVSGEPWLEPTAPPLRILLVSAQPDGTRPVAAAEELERISEALDRNSGVVHRTLENATSARLRLGLREYSPHVLHFIGHGGYDRKTGAGHLLLCDELGGADALRGPELRTLLCGLSSLRLLVLNACDTATLPRRKGLDVFSSTAGALLREDFPAVVAMQFPISDRAAVPFATSFYRALAGGDPVEGALVEGRQAILDQDRKSGGFEWATPVLYLRVQDGDLFRFGRGGRPE